MDEFEVNPLEGPNLNSCTVAGVVGGDVVRAGKQQQGLRFAVRYAKAWPGGNTSTVEIPCYTSGERAAELSSWLKSGACVLAQGELTPRPGAGGVEVYARRVERLSEEG